MLRPTAPDATYDWRVGVSEKPQTDLVLDSAAAGQFVAVTDGNYDGGLEEKRVSSLKK